MAARFWVGGTGDWDAATTTHWSATSGGAGGASVPGSADTVTLDGASGGGTVTVTAAVNVTSITSGAHTGTLNTNAQTITVQSWSGTGTATRTLNITNSTINVTGTSGTPWDFGTTTGLTFTSTGSTINISGNGNRGFTPGTLSYGTVAITGSGLVTSATASTATFVNLSRVGTAVTTDSFIIAAFTITGTLTLTGNSQVNRLMVQSSAVGTNRTVTAAAVALTNVDFANVAAAGAAAPFTGTSLGNAHGNSQITFTGAVTRFWIGGTGNYSDITHWSATSGGAGSATMPLPQDTAVFDASSFSGAGQTVTINVPRLGAQDWSAATNAPTLAFTANYTMYGSIDIPTGTGAVIISGNFTGTFSPQTGTVDVNLHIASITVTSLIVDIGFVGSITITAPGATIRLLSHFMTNAQLTLNSGTLTGNDFSAQYVFFTSTGSATRVLNMGAGTWLSTSNGTLWNVTSTGMTLNAGTSTIRFISLSSPSKTFAGAGLTYANFWGSGHSNQTSDAEIIFTGANVFTGELKVTASDFARNVTFPASTTTSVGSLFIEGKSGAITAIRSSSAGSAATLSDASGTNTANFCSIKDITAAGGATWTATNSTNVSGNTGWVFSTGSPAVRRTGLGMGSLGGKFGR